MANYSSQTVAQLKELLKARGLTVNGVKADLIARLEESDKIDAELDEQEAQEEPVEAGQEVKKVEKVETVEAVKVVELPAQPVEPVAVQPVKPATTPIQPKEQAAPAAPALTLDQLKDAAVKSLEQKITRAQRFNSEEDVKSLETTLKRIQKFGVSPESAIARELGYKTEAQKKKEEHDWKKKEAERKTREYQQSRSKDNRLHGHRRQRERYTPYARERTN